MFNNSRDGEEGLVCDPQVVSGCGTGGGETDLCWITR